MTAFERFSVFVVVVFIAGASLWAWVIEKRTDELATIAESAERIEQVASNTEDMLEETITERQTPESQAEREAVRQAVREITTIKALLCDLPELSSHEACP